MQRSNDPFSLAHTIRLRGEPGVHQLHNYKHDEKDIGHNDGTQRPRDDGTGTEAETEGVAET